MPTTLPAEVLTAFDLGDPVGESRPVAEAWSNEVFRLHTRSGDYAVKVLAPATESSVEHAAGIEAAVLATGAVPMAQPVRASGAGWLARLSDGRIARCHRWVHGSDRTDRHLSMIDIG